MRRRRYRRNPDDLLNVLLIGGAVAIGYAVWKNAQPTTTPGEDTNFPSGNILGIDTSGASGVTSYTSHPSGHGQQYV